MQENQGLAGAMTGLTDRIKGLKADPLMWIIRLVALAAFILIWKKSGLITFGWENAAVILILGVAALMAEFYLSRETARAFHERAAASMLMFALLWAGAFAYSVNQWLGVASEGQFEKAGFQQAAFNTTADTRADLELARKALKDQSEITERIKAERWAPLPNVDGKAISSGTEAKAIFDGLKAQTRLWNLTDGCTKSAGSTTKAFVKTCSEAKAAMAASEKREAMAGAYQEASKLLAQREAEYRAASSKSSSAPVVTSATRVDLRMYTRYAGLSEEAAMDMQAAGTIIFVSLLLSGLGWLREAKEHRNQPRKPWPFGYAIRRAIWGDKAYSGSNRTFVVDNEALKKWANHPSVKGLTTA